ncbi:MAG: hypothetical protein ACAI44_03935 [Candidatus Sericytochromatia bacterium]
MNHSIRLFLASLLFGCLALSGCGDGKMHLHGHMESFEFEGQRCWIFVDDNHKKYEVITPSSEVLRDGIQMSIRAEESESKTLCQLPTVIDVVEYRYDFAKDN